MGVLNPKGKLLQGAHLLPVTPGEDGEPDDAAERLRAFMAEIDLPVPGLEPLDCDSGTLPGSQCALVTAGTFRLVGAFSQGKLTGRVLMGTVRARVLLNTVAEFTVHLMQLVAGDSLVIQDGPSTPFLLRLGTGALPIGARRAVPLAPAERRVLAIRPGQVFGDTDGDFTFTPMDVLFMEAYMSLSVFQAGAKNVCVLTGRCQSTTRMTVWQLLQLKRLQLLAEVGVNIGVRGQLHGNLVQLLHAHDHAIDRVDF
jgi:hypothetical protein